MDTVKKRYENLRPAVYTTIVILISMLLIAYWAARQLPADIRLPVHWNANGHPDRYAGKFLGLYMMPIVIFVMTLLMVCLPRIEPRQKHIKMSMKSYNLILISMVLVFAALHITMIMNALGKTMSIDKIVPAIIGILFIFMGNYMGKIRSNFMLGIKTPWTLTSELSWNKTHRLGGRLFVLSGFLIVLSSFLGTGKIRMVILLCSVFGTVAITFIYSYLVWQKDPQKQNRS